MTPSSLATLYFLFSTKYLMSLLASFLWLKNTYAASTCWCSLTFAHILSDNVNGLLRHHSIKLHQLVMAKFLHDLSLLQERLGGHGTWLQGLHCHFCGAIPRTWRIHAGTHRHIQTRTGIGKGTTLIPIQILALDRDDWQLGVNSRTLKSLKMILRWTGRTEWD